MISMWTRRKSLPTKAACIPLESLQLFRPTESQKPVLIGDSKITLVIGGNRAGKSLVSAVRFASIATDIPITLADGELVDLRRQDRHGKPLVMWCVGGTEDSIGRTLHRLLFQCGAFKIINDAETGAWRAFDPANATDASRASEAIDAPPLIPSHYIDQKSWTWFWKDGNVFEKVTIVSPKTGVVLAHIYGRTASSLMDRTDGVDELWLDEVPWIHMPSGVGLDRWLLFAGVGGRVWWSSWPDSGNSLLVHMHEIAAAGNGAGRPLVREFSLSMLSNPHVPCDIKRDVLAHWSAEDAARGCGEFVFSTASC